MSFIQSAANGSASATAITVNLSSTGAGNALVIATRNGVSADVPTFTYNAGTPFSPTQAITGSEIAITDNGPARLWIWENIPSGVTSITASTPAAARLAVCVHEHSNIRAANLLDQLAEAIGNSQTPASGSTPATTQANELVASLFVMQNSFSGGSATDGLANYIDRPNERLGLAAKYVTSTGPQSGGFAVTSVAQAWYCSVATFKEVGVLDDTGLLVRYYLDEAASGTAPTAVEDLSANNYDLTEVNYGAGNMAYAEPAAGHRGLDSISVTGTQRARRAISNTSDVIRNAAGGTQYTLEVVCHIDTSTSGTSRVFGINDRLGNAGTIMLRGEDNRALALGWNNQVAGLIPLGTLPDANRHVVHVVIDTTQATAGNRVRYSIDGGTLQQAASALMAQNEVLSIPSDSDLTMLNRESSGAFDRSINGAVYYAAIYNAAFTQGRIEDHYDVLSLSDDQPSDDVPTYGTGRMQVAADAFPTAIESTWENGPAGFFNMQWISGGVVGPINALEDAGMRRQGEAGWRSNQFSTIVIGTQSKGASGQAYMGAAVRIQAGPNNGGYVGSAVAAASHTYQIFEVSAAFGWTSLGSVADPGGEIPLGSDEAITLEAYGTSLRLGSDSAGTDVEKFATTDGTFASGFPGLHSLFTNDATVRVTEWRGGHIDAAVTPGTDLTARKGWFDPHLVDTRAWF